MKILLSIKPEYAEKILDGRKHFEFRKKIFKRSEVRTIVIYATKPLGKVVGEFEIDEILEDKPDKIWRLTKNKSGITKSFFNTYFEKQQTAFAIKVGTIQRYEKPLDLQDVIPGRPAPQSFCYLSK